MQSRLFNLLFHLSLLFLVYKLLIRIEVFSAAHDSIELPKIQLDQSRVECGRSAYLLSVLVQVFIEECQIYSIVVVRAPLLNKFLRNKLPYCRKLSVRQPRTRARTLLSHQNSHFFLNFLHIGKSVSVTHKLQELFHLSRGIFNLNFLLPFSQRGFILVLLV